MAVFNEPTKWAQTLGKDADVVAIPDIAGDTDPSIDKIFPAAFSIPLAHGGKAIPRSVLNGLFKLLGDWSFYQQNGGIASYSAIFDYAIGRVVLYNGNLYKCIQANGVSSTVVAPDSGTEYWQRLDNFVRSVNGVNADTQGNVSITSVNHATSADRLIGYDNHNAIYLGWDGNSLTMNVDDVASTKGEIITHLNISSQSVKHATTADTANRAYPRMVDGSDINFHWEGRTGQPTWLWGGEDGSNMYVYNPSNFSVNHALKADNATNLGGYPATDYIRSVTGEIKWFAFNTAPDGYLVCNGASVSRTTYADLFNAIGTAFGSGDGSTTFALPNLIDKFAQGSTTVGTVKSAGLPNILGNVNDRFTSGDHELVGSGAFYTSDQLIVVRPAEGIDVYAARLNFDASRSNSIYGSSTTVQPPALTLLPCIKY